MPGEAAAIGRTLSLRRRSCTAAEHRSSMNLTALSAAFGVLVILASAAFFVVGRRIGRAAELERQRAARASAEEFATRIRDEAERDAEARRKSAVIAGKEELIKLREAWEIEARRR